jgi:hypothetical protein
VIILWRCPETRQIGLVLVDLDTIGTIHVVLNKIWIVHYHEEGKTSLCLLVQELEETDLQWMWQVGLEI